MMGGFQWPPDVARMLAEPAAIPALRVGLFMFAFLAALAWLNRAPRLALLLLSLGGALGLSYWLGQVVSPLGLEGTTLGSQWAQAGVNARAEPGRGGFVVGTRAEPSLPAALAASGLPLELVHATPQVFTLLFLGLVVLLPWLFVRTPTNAAFAAALGLGGGLWPGIAPYRAVLCRPSLLMITAAAVGAAAVLARRREFRRAFNHSRTGWCGGLLAVAATDRAMDGGAEASALGALVLVCISMILASPLRAAIRRWSFSAEAALRIEALLLLAAFAGSGLFWWTPTETVPGFAESRNEGVALRRLLDWVAANVPRSGVVLASRSYSIPIAAVAGRRVLFPPLDPEARGLSLPEPSRRARLLESTLKGRPIARLAAAFSVTDLLLGPGEPTPVMTDENGENDAEGLSLVLVYQDSKDFRVFRLAKK